MLTSPSDARTRQEQIHALLLITKGLQIHAQMPPKEEEAEVSSGGNMDHHPSQVDTSSGSMELEYVLVDARLEYIDLIRLPGPSEILAVEGDDFCDDAFYVVPAKGWHVDDCRQTGGKGWLHVPAEGPTDSGHSIGEDWWLGLRYAADLELRPHLSFSMLSTRRLRLFIVPLHADRCARCLLVTHTRGMLPDLLHAYRPRQSQCFQPDPPFVPALQVCVAGPTGGEWPSSSVTFSTAESAASPCGQRAASENLRLYSHQWATVEWMREVESRDAKSRVIHDPCPALKLGPITISSDGSILYTLGSTVHVPLPAGDSNPVSDPVALPGGGIIAHPVGAGKTLAVAALVAGVVQNTGGSSLSSAAADCGGTPSRQAGRSHHAAAEVAQAPTTLVLAPDHLLAQWRKELSRVKGARQAVCLVGHGRLDSLDQEVVWDRLVIDEPQEIVRDVGLYERVLATSAKARWALCATPDQDLRWHMSLIYGRELSSSEFRRSRRHFIEACTLRDPCGRCLPVPPLRHRLVPVTLSMEESSTLAVLAGRGHTLERLVEAACCPEWAMDASINDGEFDQQSTIDEEEEQHEEKSESFSDFERWYKAQRERHQRALEAAEKHFTELQELIQRQGERYASMQADGQMHQELESLTLVYNPPADDAAAGVTLLSMGPQGGRLMALWAGGPYHPIGTHAGRPLYRYRRRRRYLAFNEQLRCWGLYDSDPALGPLYSSAPVFISGLESANCLLPAEVVCWYRLAESQGAGAQAAEAADGEIFTAGRQWVKAEGLMVHEDHIEKVEGLEVLVDDERGVDDELWSQLDAAEARVRELRRAGAFADNLRRLMADPETECCVCLAPLAGRAVTVLSCLHAFDEACIRAIIRTTSSGGVSGSTLVCPVCRARTRRREQSTFLHMPSSGASAGGVFDSTKLRALCSLVHEILDGSPHSKVVIFAKWQRLLHICSMALNAKGVKSFLLSHRRPRREKRDRRGCRECGVDDTDDDDEEEVKNQAALSMWNQPVGKDNQTRVLLLSYHKHASGLNLHGANHVILLHPYINTNIMAAELVPLGEAQTHERQAVGRVHRYPQMQTVIVHRMFARGSVEEELYAVWGLLTSETAEPNLTSTP